MELGLQALWLFGVVALLGTLGVVARLALPPGWLRLDGRDLLPLLLLGTFAVGAAPAFVSEFAISPDSLEYVAGAQSLAHDGRFELPFGEPPFTPRYPPWFSALWIAPVLFTGVDIGWAIVPVTVSAVLALLCAFRLGVLIGGAWGGTLSVLGMLLVPGFVFFSRQVLIDIPFTMLVLGGGLVFILFRATPRPPLSLVVLGGLLVGWAVLLRPTGIVIALPYALSLLRVPLRNVRNWVVFLAPILTAVSARMAYNQLSFGDVSRSGYNLWCSIPYDFTSLAFGARYVFRNAGTIFIDSGLAALLVFLVAGAVAVRRVGLARRDMGSSFHDPARAEILAQFAFYTGMVGIPLTVFHLVYFFPAVRFIVPISTLVAVLIGGMAGSLVESRGVGGFGRAVCSLLVALTVGGYRLAARGPVLVKGDAARAVREMTPEESLIISGIDPVYLSLMASRDREYLPISRRVEYASKFLTERRLTIDPSDVEPRCENPDVRLLSHGARQAIPRVALEDLDYVSEALARGRPVFLESTRIKSEERLRFEERFTLIEKGEGLFAVGQGHVLEQ